MRPTTIPRFNGPAEPARTVGFGRPDSARTVGFEKRDSKNGSRDSEKRVVRQGRAGQGVGQGSSVRLSCKAGGGAMREGQEPNKE
jgi:hypothetical protein